MVRGRSTLSKTYVFSFFNLGLSFIFHLLRLWPRGLRQCQERSCPSNACTGVFIQFAEVQSVHGTKPVPRSDPRVCLVVTRMYTNLGIKPRNLTTQEFCNFNDLTCTLDGVALFKGYSAKTQSRTKWIFHKMPSQPLIRPQT
jgi:hypothetical protein